MVVVIGVGLLVYEVIGLMVIDIGGGIIEVVVFLLNGIVYLSFVRIGGDKLDEVIVVYVRCYFGLVIGEVIVECIKKEIVIVKIENDDDIVEMEVYGYNFVEGVFCMFILNLKYVLEVIE